ncbi:hypothetical protein ATCC90586_003078 [Pythium insidiosum]|nr:hypothetical protein ATCC90586_003078 [Pythium insidiosum]
MWTLCRPAALRLVLARRAPPAASPALALLARALSSSTGASSSPLDLQQLLSQSSDEISAQLNRAQLRDVQRTLSHEFSELVESSDASVAPVESIVQLFEAAQKTQLPSLMLRTFEYMQQHYPEDIDFAMYGDVFRILMRQRDGARLLAVYDFARALFVPHVPEIVYRFGIAGRVALDDVDGALALLHELEHVGRHTPSNEILSHVMAGLARRGDKAGVLALHARLDPQVGAWHGSAIDRVILSLGVVEEPERAFEFYVHSSMKLNGGTLITLLSVCRHNDCRQQASDILENRKRFALRLDARGYNAILQTLEYLDRRDELVDVLAEMRDAGVRFDTKTKLIVQRNQDVLAGSYFDLAAARGRSDDAAGRQHQHPRHEQHQHEQHQRHQRDSKKPSPFKTARVLRELLAQGHVDEAVAMAHQHVRALTPEDLDATAAAAASDAAQVPAGALRAPASAAKEIVAAFIASGQHDKVQALLAGWEASGARAPFAFMEVFVHYGKSKRREDRELAYRAAKQLQRHRVPIFRVEHALQLFREAGDADAAVALYEQYLSEFAAVKSGDQAEAQDLEQQQEEQEQEQEDGESSAVVAAPRREKDIEGLRKVLTPANLGRALNWTLTILAETNRVGDAVRLAEQAQQAGVRVDAQHFVTLLSAMRPHVAAAVKAKGVVVALPERERRQRAFEYTADDMERVLEAMTQRLGLAVSRGHVGNACVALAAGSKRHRLKLLEWFAAAAAATPDRHRPAYTIPPPCYSALLRVAALENPESPREVLAVYADAVASRAADAPVPRDWETVVIAHLADCGGVDAALARVLAMPTTCGAFTYEAVVKVLRAAAAQGHAAAVDTLVELLEARDFQLTLNDAYDLVHLARDRELPELAFDVLQLYERAHGRETTDVVAHVTTHSRQHERDRYAVRRIRAMYRVALQLCEQSGQWKRALAFSSKVRELLGPLDDERSAQQDKTNN